MSLELSPPTPPATGAAPEAPGRLGSSVPPQDAFVYLRDLAVWRDRRKDELDALDSAALASSDRDAFSRDMLVSMALWKAISDRYDLLEMTFDSGRVGPKEAERISALIWGRLDVEPGSAASALAPSTSGALALSLPEACRLSDAMTSSLRARLSLEPSGAEVGTRLRSVRETVERVRDQLEYLPAGAPHEAAAGTLRRLESRLADLVEKAKRGADVGGLLAPLEYDASTAERDLIVDAGRRLAAVRDAQRAAVEREELAARGAAIRRLEAQCVAAVDPAPRLAVPDVSALGEVPSDPDAVEAYLRRLDAVSRALTAAQAAYAGALAEREELVGLSGAYQAQAKAAGAVSPDLEDLARRLDETLAARPAALFRARGLLAAYQAYLATVTARPTPRGAGR